MQHLLPSQRCAPTDSSHLSLSSTEGTVKKEIKAKDIKKRSPGKKGFKVGLMGTQGPHAPVSLSSIRPTITSETQMVTPGVDTSFCVAGPDPGHPTRMHPNRRRHHQVYPLMGAHDPQDPALVPVCP